MTLVLIGMQIIKFSNFSLEPKTIKTEEKTKEKII